ncbi:MAG TPA: protein phosphatase 2C domain-containing protein [Amycolatopsis sp.]|uniref:PP2C family serine/threonine-protein phosphatase n=1 Tax=Amycolatopsis sp. TaxID=37632 RepID=UPI002B49665E|nr:protein phosphatase 2C domain-containing protein [Amycolatopsis sp.]HKS46507.1 protein phosphatase 2C domain-containing protein [Amycolatopsis sp.]
MTLAGCPGCGEAITPEDRFCEGCGTSLRFSRTPAGGPPWRDRMEYDLGPVAGVSDRGSARARNEDAMALAVVGAKQAPEAVVAVVCDGVGSTAHADAAAQAAVDAALDGIVEHLLTDSDPTEATVHGSAGAYASVAELARPSSARADLAPSCTFVSAVVTPGGITVGWIGDSRAYWVSDSGSRLLTTDDAEPVAGALTRWVGADAEPAPPHLVTLPPGLPGRLVVCSDGLWNYLPTAEILATQVPAAPPSKVAAELTAVALHAGGRDNITVVVIPWPLEGENA